MSWIEDLPSFSLEEAEFKRLIDRKPFAENLHPRSHGKFTRKPGTGLPTPRRAPLGTGPRAVTPSTLAAHTAQRTRDAASVSKTARAAGKPGRAGKLKPDKNGVYDVGSDVNAAADLLSRGEKVQLDQPKSVSILLDKLAAVTADMKAKGENAPNFDLCKITVPGTNLFCAESKGIPRVKMPQLGGVPTKGSLGDRELPKNSVGGIDLTDLFRKHLESKGIRVRNEDEKASLLKATQNQLNGGKVGQMMKVLDSGKELMGDPRLFVSRDNYIVDGHHRWAANVGHDLEDGHLGDVKMPVARIDTDIITLLSEANKFAEHWGIPQAGVTDVKGKAA